MHFSKRVEFVRRLIRAEVRGKTVHALEKLGALQVSYILRQFRDKDRVLLIDALIDTPLLKPVLTELSEESLPEVLNSLSREQRTAILNQMPADWGWSYLQTLDEEEQQLLLQSLSEGQQKEIHKWAIYPKGSCGEVMASELLCIKNTTTIADAIHVMRSADPLHKIFYLYVVDEERHLLGTVPLRSLLQRDPTTPIADVTVTHHVAVQAMDPQNRAAEMVSQHKLLAVPVVDESYHLLGVIRIDDVMEIVQEEATEEMYRMAGLTKRDRLFAPWWQTFQKRLGWMSINLGTAFLAAWTVGLFQDSIRKVVALAIFMPLVAGMGGNGGTQALAVMTRALALGEIEGREVWRVLRKEVLIGFMVGGVTGLATGLIAWRWQGNFYLGFVLWLAMMANMMIAGFSGAVVPMILRRLRKDPALGSGVLVTTFTDVFGFFCFLGLATLFLKYL